MSKTNPKLPLVIVNPKSAGGGTRDIWAAIASDLRAHFGPFQVAFTKGPGDGISIAEKAARDNRGLIVAVGGDGTINEVANGIMLAGNRETELGVLPSGTGGDFRRTIGMPAEPREAAKALRTGETKEIDIGLVSFVDSSGEPVSRYFLNVSSFGLSAEINERVSANRLFGWIPLGATIRGRAKFAYSTLQEVMEISPKLVSISIDGGEARSVQTLNFCVCNARYFGGGMKIAPEAKLSDGYFDVVNIGDINTARILLNGYKLYNGTHLELPEVKSLKAKKIEVSPVGDTPVNIETDGEAPGMLPATFEIVEKAIKVRVPRKENF